ncbi:MAG TPA: recombinase family protein [bacterium]|nr:recombinase family protein [bacterium]
MRVGIYARVSTADKDQNPETQLLPLREFVAAQGSTTAGEYIDHASATDLRGRKSWRRLLDDAARRHVDLVLVWRLDRAFRSVHEAANTLERLRGWRVGLRSYSEPWLDTTSPFGEALYYITVAYAQLERGIIAERVRAGMDRARRQGKHLGRPQAVNGLLDALRPQIEAGELSRRAAARQLGVSVSTVSRALSRKGGTLLRALAAPRPS